MKDFRYMELALELAIKGSGMVNPNPMVGAVIVKDNIIIAQGYHKKYGELHAERNALKNCTTSPRGSTMYVTLEPCCHYEKTPPCTEAIINSGIKRIVIGTLDPNPIMAGKSIEILRGNKIQVDIGILEHKCKDLIRIYTKFITTGKPYVIMKYAMTMDGKIETYKNQSKWITSEKARLHVHESRHEYSAIMIGVNTVIHDDPLLTCRLKNGKNPIRIICDTNLQTPLSARVIKTAHKVKTLLVTCSDNNDKKKLYEEKGCRILKGSKKNSKIDLAKLMRILGNIGIDSILLEGGSTLNWSALEDHIVDRVQTYIAPKIFGGIEAKSPVGGLGVSFPEEAFQLTNSIIKQYNNDYLIESEVVYRCLQE